MISITRLVLFCIEAICHYGISVTIDMVALRAKWRRQDARFHISLLHLAVMIQKGCEWFEHVWDL